MAVYTEIDNKSVQQQAKSTGCRTAKNAKWTDGQEDTADNDLSTQCQVGLKCKNLYIKHLKSLGHETI